MSRSSLWRTVIVLGVMLLSTPVASAQERAAADRDWTFIAASVDGVDESVLDEAEERVTGPDVTTTIPLWVALEPFVNRDRCHNVSLALPPIESYAIRRSDVVPLALANLKLATSPASQFADSLGRVEDDFERWRPPPVATMNLSEYNDLDRSWLADALLFCESVDQIVSGDAVDFLDLAIDSRPGLFGHVTLDPNHWARLQGDDFLPIFQAHEALLRRRADVILGQEYGQDNQLEREWVGINGLIPALARHEAEQRAAPVYEGFDDPFRRRLFMPMDFTEDFRRGARRGETYTAEPFWRLMIQHYFPDDPYLLSRLLRTQYYGGSDPVAVQLDRMMEARNRFEGGALQLYFGHVAASVMEWPDTLFDGAVDGAAWRDELFDGCLVLEVWDLSPYNARSLTLPDMSARCVEVRITSEAAAFTGSLSMQFAGAPATMEDVAATVAKSQSRYCGRDGLDAQPGALVIAPCTLNLLQARPEPGRAVEYETTEEFSLNPGEEIVLRYALTRMPPPEEINDYTGFEMIDSGDIEITASLDLVSVDVPDAMRPPFATTYGAKRDSGRVGPVADAFNGTAEQAIFERNAGTSRAVIERAAESARIMLGVTNRDGDSINFTLNDPNVLPGEAVGTFEAQASASLNSVDWMVIQDPDAPSTVEILEHEAQTLRFRGEAAVCLIDPDAMGQRIAALAAGGGPEPATLCDFAFERTTWSVTGAIAFPRTWTAEGMLETWETDLYRAERAARAEQIRAAGYSFGSPGSGATPGRPSGVPGGGGDGPDTASGAVSGPCGPIYSDAAGCDCSCEARACFSSRDEISALIPGEQSCRLICAASWRQCPE